MSVPCEMLLHPELLSNEQLTYIIQERHLRIPNLENMRRDELLDVFHNYCVPYGQRKYRDSGRGRMLNKTRPMSPETPTKLDVMLQEYKKSTNPGCTRLKPPPDLLSGHMKRIKIESSETPIKIQNYSKRKMSVDNISPVTDCPPPKKERKPITWP